MLPAVSHQPFNSAPPQGRHEEAHFRAALRSFQASSLLGSCRTMLKPRILAPRGGVPASRFYEQRWQLGTRGDLGLGEVAFRHCKL